MNKIEEKFDILEIKKIGINSFCKKNKLKKSDIIDHLIKNYEELKSKNSNLSNTLEKYLYK